MPSKTNDPKILAEILEIIHTSIENLETEDKPYF